MYPFVRLIKEMVLAKRQPKLAQMGDVHVTHHICWPWDLDMFMELNNGRTLSIYDLGRLPLALRGGLVDAMRTHKWAMTMAGATVRYRHRVTAFERIEMRSRALCWDDRFMYLEQSMWKRDGKCSSHVIYRVAVTENGRMIAPSRMAEAIGQDPVSPPMPDWVSSWVAAEAGRPWPPMQNAV